MNLNPSKIFPLLLCSSCLVLAAVGISMEKVPVHKSFPPPRDTHPAFVEEGIVHIENLICDSAPSREEALPDTG